MSGFAPFLGKELREIRRTWRMWVLPGIVLLVAITGPVVTMLMPDILGSLTMNGVVIEVPDPTWADAYGQWAKDLTQVVALALVISLGGVIASEVRNGTAVMVLTKPVSRTAFVLAKAAASALMVLGAALLGMAVMVGLTALLFPGAPVTPALAATAAWLVLALVLGAVTLLGSAAFSSATAASGAGLGAFLLLGIVGIWGPAARWSPAGLTQIPAALAAGHPVEWVWPVMTGLTLTAVLVGAAVVVFRRRELAA